MNYCMLVLMLFVNTTLLLGKCACHENQQTIAPAATVKPWQETIEHQHPLEQTIAPEAPEVQPATVPTIVPNVTSEIVMQAQEIVSANEAVTDKPAHNEQEQTEDLRTTAQRAAVLCAAIGVVGFILYKATSHSPLERVVSEMERKTRV